MGGGIFCNAYIDTNTWVCVVLCCFFYFYVCNVEWWDNLSISFGRFFFQSMFELC